jgi:hypothetical protein
MTRDEMIHYPEISGPVRTLGPVDVPSLIKSLQPYIEQQLIDKKQIALRKPEDWDGVGELRDSGRPLNVELYMSFNVWVDGTEVLQSIAADLGIKEFGRIRMLNLIPRTNYTFHYDPDSWRVHIPLITNEDAFMIVAGKLWHLPIGNAYLIKVKDYHSAMNAGKEDRIHIVFDWCDNLAGDTE